MTIRAEKASRNGWAVMAEMMGLLDAMAAVGEVYVLPSLCETQLKTPEGAQVHDAVS